MSRIVFARHGETVWHADNRYAGCTDVPLTPRGLKQGILLANWAKTARLSAVWSSPMTRARLTAQPSADAAGVQLQIDPRLREINFGWAEGLTTQEMYARLPDARAAFVKDPVSNFFQGGENPVNALERGKAVFYDAATAVGEDERVLIVAHSTLFRLVLCHLLKVPLYDYRRIFPSLASCALTEIRFNTHSTSLLSFNVPLPGVFEVTL